MSREFKYILLVYPGIAPISRDEVIGLFTKRYNKEPDKEIFLNENSFIRNDLASLNWEKEKIKLELEFNKKINPLLKENKCRIGFFGVAPIPLAFYLGFLIDSHHMIDIFEKHHTSKKWFYDQTVQSNLEVEVYGKPKKQNKKNNDSSLRISTSQIINLEDIKQLNLNTKENMELKTIPVGYDNISNDVDRKLILKKFNEIINSLIQMKPNLNVLHLFVAAPTGITFLLGNAINSTMYPRIQIYQYSKKSNTKYINCFDLNCGGQRNDPEVKSQKLSSAKITVICSIIAIIVGGFFKNRIEDIWKHYFP